MCVCMSHTVKLLLPILPYLHYITFHTFIESEPEMMWNIYDLMEALRLWLAGLLGRHFTVRTDPIYNFNTLLILLLLRHSWAQRASTQFRN